MTMNETAPKYQVVYEELKHEIVSGVRALGEKMPSELQLMEKYGYSRHTIRKALEELTQDGYVQKVRGSGSFVKKPPIGENHPKTIMFVALFAQHHFFSQYIGGVEQELKESGYSLNIGISNNNPEEEAKCLEDAMERGYAGVLLLPAQSACIYSNLHIYKKVREARFPCVTLGGRLAHIDFPCVVVDDYEGGKRATQYLIGKGHRRIACVMNQKDYSGCMRYSGYRAALREAGIREDPRWTRWYGYEAMQELLEDEKAVIECFSQVTAVFCFNDEVALGVIRLLEKYQIRVPEDVSVVGYDDSYMCMFGEKKLTSVHQDPLEVGRQAAKTLLKMIQNPNSGTDIFFEPTIVERETVKELSK